MWDMLRDGKLSSAEKLNLAFDFDRIFGLELDAVSYTHLRAHETVLDLVCRLLLEKQKKHTTNKHIMHYNTKPVTAHTLHSILHTRRTSIIQTYRSNS